MAKAKAKAKASTLFDNEEEFVIPDDVIDMYEICHKFWMMYFKPEQPLSEEDKQAIRDRYNAVADRVNKKQGKQMMLPLTKETKWVPTKMYANDGVVASTEQPKQVAKPLPKKEAEKQPEKPSRKPSSTSILQNTGSQISVPAKKEGGLSKCEQIIELHKTGKSNKEIIAMGFNKSTVARQVSEYKQKNK